MVYYNYMNNKIYNDKFRQLSIYVGELRKFAVHTYLEVEKIKSKLEELSNDENGNGNISKKDLKEIIDDLKTQNTKEMENILNIDPTEKQFKFNIDDF